MGRNVSPLVALDLPATPIHQFQVFLEVTWNGIICLISKSHEAAIVGLVDAFLYRGIVRLFRDLGHGGPDGIQIHIGHTDQQGAFIQ